MCPELAAIVARMGFERLRVYQAAQRLDVEVRAIVAEVGHRHLSDTDHLTRSAGSILYNIAEAYGAVSPGVERNRLGTARGESDEVRAVLRRLASRNATTEKRIRYACELTSVTAKMLTAWIRRTHDPAPKQ